MAPDAIFSDPQLARLYDALNPMGEEQRDLVELAGAEPLHVLDLGCGTGRVAVALAERGHTVVGVDPAAAMLEVASARDVAGSVRWIEGDARDPDLGHDRFDLIVMTGNVFQVFLTDDDVRAVLAACRRLLAPGGRLTFESRDPSAREWDGWTPEETHEVVHVDGLGDVEVCYALLGCRGELITFETQYVLPGGVHVTSPSTLRCMTKERIAEHLAIAGFDTVSWYRDWRGTPFGPGALEIVPVATV